MIELKLDGGKAEAVTGNGVVTVGRAWMNDLVLWDAPHVSGRHGQVEERDGALFYRDLGSRNGSRVLRAGGDVQRCEAGGEAVQLEPGDKLLLGSDEAAARILVGLVDEAASGALKLLTTLAADRPLMQLAGMGSDRGRSFNQFVVGLIGELSPEQAMDLLSGTVLENFPRILGVALYLDGDDPAASRGRDGAPHGIPDCAPLLQHVHDTGEAIVFEETGDGDPMSGFCVPLAGSHGVAGALVARCGPDDATEEDLRLLQTYTHYAGRVVEDAQRRRDDASRIVQLDQINQDLRARLKALDPSIEILGDDPLLGTALEQAARVAPYPTAVLITGPTGTGKELVARAIHRLSDRRDGPFLALNCGALAENLLESELFGHEKGAFTGADRAKVGLFGAADGGTLFLDEIGEISPALQVRLLRVVQEGEILRVGSTRPTRVDVRILAATHRDLKAEVDKGAFREDLYYRLSVFPVQLPPLKDRPGDVPILASHFAQRFANRFGKGKMTVAPSALEKLACEAWPGNVRELQNRIERAVILCDGAVIEARHVAGDGAPVAEDDSGFPSLKDARRDFTRQHVNRALQLAGGVQREAARLLGVDPGNLSRLLRELGMR